MIDHPEASPDDVDPKAFQQWLDEYPRGALGVDLSEALAECVYATRVHEKASAMTLQIKIGPGKSDLGEVVVSAEVTTKLAKPTPPQYEFFPTDTGGLSRSDPNQPRIPGMENT